MNMSRVKQEQYLGLRVECEIIQQCLTEIQCELCNLKLSSGLILKSKKKQVKLNVIIYFI